MEKFKFEVTEGEVGIRLDKFLTNHFSEVKPEVTRSKVKMLIERGAEVNLKGWTPLHYAATKGHIAMMRLLLENNAYIDAESPNGTTPLMMSAFYGTPASVKLLWEEGADPTPRNQSHVNALDLALKAERQQSAFYIRAFTEAWVIKESGE